MEEKLSISSGIFTKQMTLEVLINTWVHILYMRNQIVEKVETPRQNGEADEILEKSSNRQRKQHSFLKSFNEAKKSIKEFHDELTISKATILLGSTIANTMEAYELEFPQNIGENSGSIGTQTKRVSNSVVRGLCGAWGNVSWASTHLYINCLHVFQTHRILADYLQSQIHM